jgi:hypothetical protein
LRKIGSQDHYTFRWSKAEACPSVTLEKKQVRHKLTTDPSTYILSNIARCVDHLMDRQLLMLSDDGFASLMDAEGNVSEDTLIPHQLRPRLYRALAQGKADLPLLWALAQGPNNG